MTLDEASINEELLARFTESIGQMSRDLAGWIPVLNQLAEAEALRTLALGHCSEITASTVRSIIAARQLRDRLFWPLMNESAWILMLDIFANRLEGERQDAATLSDATGIAFDTTLHWIDWLVGRGVLFRNGPAGDDECALIDFTDAGADQMRAYLLAAVRISPWVQ